METVLTPSRWEPMFVSWSKGPGDTEKTKCENAVKAIRKAIAAHPQLSQMGLAIDAHGSYPNRTNVAQESDADVYIRLPTTIFYDIPLNTTPADFGLTPPGISYAAYKVMVQEALVAHFGTAAVTPGNKAFDIHENTNRVDADAVAALGYHRYISAATPARFESGFSFESSDGKRIINYPDQVYKNGIDKHEATGKRYKKVVRILKYLRNSMQEDRVPAANDVASTLIEGLVWNVPNNQFGSATLYEDVQKVLISIYGGVKDDTSCAHWREVNNIKDLFHPTQPWTRQKAHDFIVACYNFIGYK